MLNGTVAWLGTDGAGRDVLSAIIFGLRTSLVVAISSAVIALIAGLFVGLIAGFYGGGWGSISTSSISFCSSVTINLALLAICWFSVSMQLACTSAKP
mgnify:CR=1 FL=1